GTGVITKAILDSGVDPKRLIVLERDPKMAEFLRRRFPEPHVLGDDALHLGRILQKIGGKDIVLDTIVSGLPLRSIPSPIREGIVREWRENLSPHGKIIQFTYDIRNRDFELFRGFKKIKSSVVW